MGGQAGGWGQYAGRLLGRAARRLELTAGRGGARWWAASFAVEGEGRCGGGPNPMVSLAGQRRDHLCLVSILCAGLSRATMRFVSEGRRGGENDSELKSSTQPTTRTKPRDWVNQNALLIAERGEGKARKKVPRHGLGHGEGCRRGRVGSAGSAGANAGRGVCSQQLAACGLQLAACSSQAARPTNYQQGRQREPSATAGWAASRVVSCAHSA